jgi:hypothetical protein
MRLRESLLSNEAKSFRRRNPRVSRSLTSKMAPAIGSSLAGFFLAVYPGNQLRITIAIYIFTRALEFSYNYLEELGYFRNRPSWFGSWMLMPFAYGQLLHAFVFDRGLTTSPETCVGLPHSISWTAWQRSPSSAGRLSSLPFYSLPTKRSPGLLHPSLPSPHQHILPLSRYHALFSIHKTLRVYVHTCSTGCRLSPRLPVSLPSYSQP